MSKRFKGWFDIFKGKEKKKKRKVGIKSGLPVAELILKKSLLNIKTCVFFFPYLIHAQQRFVSMVTGSMETVQLFNLLFIFK